MHTCQLCQFTLGDVRFLTKISDKLLGKYFMLLVAQSVNSVHQCTAHKRRCICTHRPHCACRPHLFTWRRLFTVNIYQGQWLGLNRWVPSTSHRTHCPSCTYVNPQHQWFGLYTSFFFFFFLNLALPRCHHCNLRANKRAIYSTIFMP